MRIIRTLLLLAGFATLAACGEPKVKPYDGPEVTQIYVNKSARKMYLLHQKEVLKSYEIALGFAPQGHKQFEGDGRTPEGLYYINRRNPNSAYHLSIGISYPNPNDREAAKAMGKHPGGDIFIHGQAGKNKGRPPDWTAGCIAVDDAEIEDIYAMVRDGTPIYITP
ncbi:L,D-transpeptidase family protein [Frigidibacter mobilis]|uniref:ErfK/YbiS/YcfS/YnhG family protein n=1 Tax=Frigidibacter mobilis TaxID=1335048 RepID=A0A161GXA4_9RHOB|nr:L,D-transpeptidase family protein [Frigidibacter mobilis]AMY71779.1 ErfK/YbiS/YcfS/YnhG family protein [Frigidibacter mobilis]